MLRIGVAASKMSKGCSSSYNFYVILIACLVSLFIFFICGFSILLILFLVSLILHLVSHSSFHTGLMHVFKICLVVLGVVVGGFNIVAIMKNIQMTKK
jgi:hypothetical protein